MAYVKLFGSLVHSTIWREPNHVRIVWITLLALSDRWGVIEASVPGLADCARVTIEECREALQVLMSPDPESRNADNEGRRIEKVEGGWGLLNHEYYRSKASTENQRHANNVRVKRFRDKQKQKELKGEGKFMGALNNGASDKDLDKIVTESLPRAGDAV